MQHEDIAQRLPQSAGPDTDGRNGPAGFLRGLSGKLLILTIGFVMIAEILIFVPSVANFRNVWLQTHLDMAEAASIVYLDKADPMLSEEAQADLLESTGSLAVVINEGSMRQLMASANMPAEISAHIDLSEMRPLDSIRSALSLLLSRGEGTYRVYGPMKSRNAAIELVQKDTRLKQALRIYSRNVLLISLAISIITATLVISALYWLIVRPVRRLSTNMTAFSREPDNAALILNPTSRRDEIGTAERRLAAFETDLHNTLRQRQHLAELGLAVSKINHDLRNILASAQLFSDRISQLTDPTVQRLAPKLLRTIDRAVGYTRSVLAYGRALEATPKYRLHRLRDIAEDVAELLGLDQEGGIEWRNEISPRLEVEVDAEQIFRAIVNICRNAVQAMERQGEEVPAAVRRLTITAEPDGEMVVMRIADTGPGIARDRRAQLFRPFADSGTAGGTGLGLSIADELVRAHGGRIVLEDSATTGTVFRVTLPFRNGRSRDAAESATGDDRSTTA
jgi:signal transduction histidine kinase